jgi:hypothetical protein
MPRASSAITLAKRCLFTYHLSSRKRPEAPSKDTLDDALRSDDRALLVAHTSRAEDDFLRYI